MSAPTPEILLYRFASTVLGELLLAASEHGIRAVWLGDRQADLLSELQARFPEARLQPDIGTLTEWTRRLASHVDSDTPLPELPLDLRGTPFQQRTWQALRAIPAGRTCSYAELARQLNSHARAVAGACARNPVALLVPCHRVVGSDRRLTGYRWGLARKAALLAREGRASTGETGAALPVG